MKLEKSKNETAAVTKNYGKEVKKMEKKKKIAMQVTIKGKTMEKLEEMALNYGIPKSTTVTMIVTQYFDAMENMGTLKGLLEKAQEEIKEGQKSDIEKKQIKM